jgi:hypothetical protein
VRIIKGIQRRPNIEWEGKRMEQVEEIEYLGTIISENGKIDKRIKKECKKANNV